MHGSIHSLVCGMQHRTIGSAASVMAWHQQFHSMWWAGWTSSVYVSKQGHPLRGCLAVATGGQLLVFMNMLLNITPVLACSDPQRTAFVPRASNKSRVSSAKFF
jgi:hypothetical protein